MGAAARRRLAILDHWRAETTLAGFRSLARLLAQTGGKKIVLWLTGDDSALNPSFNGQFVLDDPAEQAIQIQRTEMEETFRLLNTADISIWPVQVRGVSNPGLAEAASAVPAREVDKLRQFQQDRAGDARLAMLTIAEGTGGEVLEGGNDLRGLLAKAASLAGSYYLLSCPFTLAAFTPHGHALGNGRLMLAPGYHRTRVRVARRGVQALARRGVLVSAQR